MLRRSMYVILTLGLGFAVFGGFSPASADDDSGANVVTFESLLREMADRDAIARFPVPFYTCKQASSYDRSQTDPKDEKTWFANFDQMQSIRVANPQRRVEWVIMDDRGPGCVVHIWAPLKKGLEKQIVRFYFDNSPKPSIEVNFYELLRGRLFARPPFAFKASDDKDDVGLGGDLYLPIPYAKRCVVTLDSLPFYHIINYRSYAPGTQVKTFAMADLEAADATLKATAKALDDLGNVAAGTPVAKDGAIEPQQELSIDLPAGENAVRTLEVTIDPKDAPQAVRSLVLTADFDGQAAIWCPLGEFFGCGTRLNPVKDWNRTVEASGKLTARWVMPYRTKGRVAVKNLGAKTVAVRLNATTSPWKWDDRSMHFRANWRGQTAMKTRPMFDWNYIDISGRGVYAGDTLTVFTPTARWYGEGDERIYIDGESFPSHAGTGTEDYYGYAWGMARRFDSPFLSMPKRDSEGRQDWRGYTTTSRVRLLDGIPHQKSLKFDMEVWAWDGKIEMDYAVGVFWYAMPGATSNREPAPAEAAKPLRPWPAK